MNINPLQRLPEKKQGMIFLLLGFALVMLYVFGIIQKSVSLAIIIISVGSIVLGCQKIGLFHALAQKLNRK